jgi:integrase
MASIHYYLKNALALDSQKALNTEDPDRLNHYLTAPLQIICSVSVKGKRIKVYTGKRIAPKFWDTKQERANTKIYKNIGTILNSFLNDLNNSIARLSEEHENKGTELNNEIIRELISPKKEENEAKLEPSFEERYNYFVQNHNTGEGYNLRASTKKKYNGFKTHLEKFAELHEIELTLSAFSESLLESFKTYLVSIKLSDNTVAKYVKAAKTFCKYYIGKGELKHFSTSSVKVTEREGEVYVMPLPEIIRMQNMQLEDERLDKAKDVFMFMCWTGQRYSDVANFKRSDIFKDEFGQPIWHLTTEKTRDIIKVPLLEYAQEILSKYEDCEKPLPIVTNQKTNDALKELALEAELSHKVKMTVFYNGIKSEKIVRFDEIISTHVARKSFITSALMLGVPERVVREISGHKDEKSFRRYVNLADSYKSRVIHNAFSRNNIEQYLNDLSTVQNQQ